MPRDDTAITPTRQDEGVTTAPLITAEQEIRALKAEVERLKVQLLEGESAGHGAADGEEEAAEAWPESGLKITYGENAYQHPNTMTFMRDSFKAGTIRALLRPSVNAVAQRG